MIEVVVGKLWRWISYYDPYPCFGRLVVGALLVAILIMMVVGIAVGAHRVGLVLLEPLVEVI